MSGQYFTENETLQNFIFNNVLNKNCLLLEPSFGHGHLLKKFLEYSENYPMDLYEIDENLKPIVKFNENQNIIYGDFLKLNLNINKKYKTIIGNPPYVKIKGQRNLYLQFIETCYNLLDPNNGELLFIVPSDFFEKTSSQKLINEMKSQGNFTNILRLNDEKLFSGASVDVLVFRYCKSLVNSLVQNSKSSSKKLSDIASIYVGFVSGLDSVFKQEFGPVKILTGPNKLENFILIDEYPTNNPIIDQHLLNNKEKLLARKSFKVNETNWFKMLLRNKTEIDKIINKNINRPRPCIYVKTISRSKEVAFIDTVKYFGSSLICIILKDNSNINNLLEFLNSPEFIKKYTYANRFKISQRELSESLINF